MEKKERKKDKLNQHDGFLVHTILQSLMEKKTK